MNSATTSACSARIDNGSTKCAWPAQRRFGLDRIQAFLPSAGRRYAERRNFDYGPGDRSNVSMLSPWIRHRLVREDEVIAAVLSRHTFWSAEKFIQEVMWRTYWKGWLEMRPSVWHRYRDDVSTWIGRLEADPALYRRWDDAVSGRTGIACFDAWARELVDLGYLHNHSRMWCASIWTFTLELPWQLGADFFLRHLLDGDPASNTLSWRWVAGLQTPGKTYLARADNIERYTVSRFPKAFGLAKAAPALREDRPNPPRPIPPVERLNTGRPVGLLITEEDCDPLSLPLPAADIRTVAGMASTRARSPLPVGNPATAFSREAVADALSRSRAVWACSTVQFDDDTPARDVIDWARAAGVAEIVAAYCPVGPAAEWVDAIRQPLQAYGVHLASVRREWDEVLWPHATRGFFSFKDKIQLALEQLGIGR